MDCSSPEREGRRAKTWKASPGAGYGRIPCRGLSESPLLGEVGSESAQEVVAETAFE